jgi:hypothetical protein
MTLAPICYVGITHGVSILILVGCRGKVCNYEYGMSEQK